MGDTGLYRVWGGGFPTKSWGTVLGIPTIRIIEFWVLPWRPPM